MRCPYCLHEKTSVIETRESDETIRRRRQCALCHSRFTTYEVARAPGLIVQDPYGCRRDFTQSWLANALVVAGADFPGSALKKVVAHVEAELKGRGSAIVTVEDVVSTAVREMGQAHGRGAGRATLASLPSAEQVCAVLDASFTDLRRASEQLPLPIER